MFNKFKNGEIVIVNGKGKCNDKIYINKIAIIICRDPYFKDYNVKFGDESEDWLDEKYIQSFR